MELITKYFPHLSKQQIDQFARLLPLYEEWNAKINVISRKDFDAFYCNHVLHALALSKIFDFETVDRCLDIGTGGGFPGIPLAIFYPKTQYTLVDSIGKKIKVVNAVKDELGLHNVTAINDRFENINTKFPVIVSRAVAPALKLVNLTRKSTMPNGLHIFLKGGDLMDEKHELLSYFNKAKWEETSISDFLSEPFFETKKVIKLKL
jgi:16S rRNA (guanine527-N7)-methyltransferase